MMKASPEIRFFIFGDNGVLFHPGVNRLWVLNPAAATAWCLLPECRDREDVKAGFARRFDIDAEQAARDVARCLEYFAREGLMEGGRPAEPDLRKYPEIHMEDVPCPAVEKWACEAFLRVPGARVRFASADRQLGEQFMNVFGRLDAGESPGDIDAAITLAREAGMEGWSVFLDDRRYACGVPESHVLPHLYFLLFHCAERGLDSRLLLHGAVLVRNGRALVLPGDAGSGKTTLAAALAAAGCELYSDELAVVDVESGAVLPFPFPMSIKAGSVEPLQTLYPGLPQVRAWDRADGKQVRYVLPPAESLPESLDDPAMPAALVFPKYDPKGGNVPERINRVEALRRLAAAGSSNRQLRDNDVEAMIRLATGCPAYSLVFGKIPEISVFAFAAGRPE